MQTIKLPTDRTGHHIILSVWMVLDTGAGFYSAFDVNFVGGGGETENPAPWSPNSVFYPVGVYVSHNGGVYRCRSAHTSNSGWVPGVAFVLWSYIRPMV